MKEIRGAVKAGSDGVYISIDVTPASSKTCISGYNQWRKAVSVKVKSQPKGGKANAEVVELFSKLLGRKVEIVKGHNSSQKVLFVQNATVEEVVEKLLP
ncbi:MAG TPA: YggU family protein [Archaeoglobus veneficus]|nr:YggU family protein [Archaeoglobus veneficus]